MKIFFEKLYKKKQKSLVVVFAAEEDEVEYAFKNFSNGQEAFIYRFNPKKQANLVL